MTNHEGNRKAKNELKFLHQIEGVKKEKDGSILWIGGSLVTKKENRNRDAFCLF